MAENAGRTRSELVADGLVVVAAGALSLSDVFVPAGSFRSPFDLLMFTIPLALALALWARRRAPLVLGWLVAAATAARSLVTWLWPEELLRAMPAPETSMLVSAAPFAAYGLLAFAVPPRRVWPPLLLLTSAALAGHPGSEELLGTAGQVAAVIVAPAVFGLYVANRRKLVHAIQERAERAEREQELLAEQARAEERAQLATEIHDIVTHRVTLMVLQAGLVGAKTDGPTSAAAEELRTTGSKALEELRDLVRVLNKATPDRAAAEPMEPLPDFSDLINASESVGLTVDLTEEGSARIASPVVGRTAYRVIQEALTNVLKHAPDSRVTLRLQCRPDSVHVNIRNTQPMATPGTSPVGVAADLSAGTGLLGLQRRIAVINGSFRAGPVPDGGFEVDAILPAYVGDSLEDS